MECHLQLYVVKMGTCYHSSSIKNITESTGDLLASYANSMRLDLSSMRVLQAEYIPNMYNAMTAANENLKNIQNHTDSIMKSNEAIMRSNAEILTIFKRITPKGDKVNIA